MDYENDCNIPVTHCSLCGCDLYEDDIIHSVFVMTGENVTMEAGWGRAHGYYVNHCHSCWLEDQGDW